MSDLRFELVNPLGKIVAELPQEVLSSTDRVFEEGNVFWVSDLDRNRFFLAATQQYLNDRLHLFGYLTLNTVYTALGFSETPEGQILGWFRDGKGGNVSFGFGEGLIPGSQEDGFRLTFNIDGLIWRHIGAKNKEI